MVVVILALVATQATLVAAMAVQELSLPASQTGAFLDITQAAVADLEIACLVALQAQAAAALAVREVEVLMALLDLLDLGL